MTGAVRMTTGRRPSLSRPRRHWTAIETAKLASAVAVLAVLLALRRWIKSAIAMPAALIAMWLVWAFALRQLGLSDPEHGWYFHSLGALSRWSPLEAARTTHLTWAMTVQLVPELLPWRS